MAPAPTIGMLPRDGGTGDRGPSENNRPQPELWWLAVPAGYLVSAVPFSNLMARWVRGVDLRQVGTGTVSGSALFEVAGFGPLAAAGVLEVAKGTVGPLLAGRDRPMLRAAAAGAAIVGHNWSPFLRGAGGRGLSPAIGALLVAAPAGAAALLSGMAIGRLVHQTAVGSLVADFAAVPVSRRAHGREASWAAAAVLLPMLVKRLAGNHTPGGQPRAVYLWRLLYDRDTPRPAVHAGVGR
jgi:glycerol-3-phosphate acyltransferase PlsY